VTTAAAATSHPPPPTKRAKGTVGVLDELLGAPLAMAAEAAVQTEHQYQLNLARSIGKMVTRIDHWFSATSSALHKIADLPSELLNLQ